ncbi:MAG TPA: CPBP family intramembrane glutamic endopeptidase [Candidatus Angelobacter sp.]|nr:CPBP family intramembrane glutamic endopeptidase [Candidatus Angelobacter sp.]
MAMETSPRAPVHPVKFLFYNDRGLRAGWRLLIFLLIVLEVPNLVLSILNHMGKLPPAGPPPSSIPPSQIISAIGVFLWVLLASWIMSRIERRPVGSYGLPLVRNAVGLFFKGYFFWGFLPLALLLLLFRVIGVFSFGTIILHGTEIVAWAAIWGAVFLMAGLVEEFAFRGYVLQTLADGIGFWPAAIILAVGFARAHMGNPGETKAGILGTFLFAIFAALTLRRTGNLWLAVGAHAGWDWGQSFFFGVADSGLQVQGHLMEPSFHGPGWITGGSVGPEGSVLTLILWAAMTGLFLLLYRSREPALVITSDSRL